MTASYTLILLYSYALFWGMRKGSMLCVTVCAPGLVPYIADQGMNWRDGLRAGIVFNIPRIILLTIIGAIIGLASFALVNDARFIAASNRAGVIGYGLVGALLFVYGIYLLMMALEEEQDLAEGKVPTCRGEGGFMPHSRLAVWFARRFGGEEGDPFLLLWGSVLGLACIGETVIALESALLGGLVASYGSSQLAAALLGASVMFTFAIGAAIPVLIVTSASGRLSSYLSAREKVLRIKIASSVLLILVGLALLFLFAARYVIAG